MARRASLVVTPAVALMFALNTPPATAHGPSVEQVGKATMTTATDEEHGAYLVGSDKHSVYLFEADTRGKGDKEAVSSCYEDCAEAWPPLVSEGEPATGGEVRSDLVGTIQRKDGHTQVTYNGWPLYYYAADQSPGHTRGHDIEEYGAEWYLVTPEGEKVEEH